MFVFGLISGRFDTGFTSVAGLLTDVLFCFGVASLSHFEGAIFSDAALSLVLVLVDDDGCGRPTTGRLGRFEIGFLVPSVAELGRTRVEVLVVAGVLFIPGRAKPELTRPVSGLEPTLAEAGRGTFGRADTGRVDVGRADTGRADPGRADTGREDPGRSDGGRYEGMPVFLVESELTGPFNLSAARWLLGEEGVELRALAEP